MGKLNGPVGAETSVEFAALPERLTVKVKLAGAGMSVRTTKLAGWPFATWPEVVSMVSTGSASVPTSPDVRNAASTALALVVEAAAFTSGGGPRVSPAEVWSPSL